MPSPNARAEVVAKFNALFGWSFPANSDRHTLATMKGYAALRGRQDLAAEIETILQGGLEKFVADSSKLQ